MTAKLFILTVPQEIESSLRELLEYNNVSYVEVVPLAGHDLEVLETIIRSTASADDIIINEPEDGFDDIDFDSLIDDIEDQENLL